MHKSRNVYPTCERCGASLPLIHSNNRKYCDECAKVINREKTREKQKKKYYSDPNGHVVDMSDQNYCKQCIYHENHSYNFLCNYYLITGQRRGCKAGVGCTQRKTKGKQV